MESITSTFKQLTYTLPKKSPVILDMLADNFSFSMFSQPELNTWFLTLKTTTGGPWSSSSEACNLVSFKQSHHEPMWMYVDATMKKGL